MDFSQISIIEPSVLLSPSFAKAASSMTIRRYRRPRPAMAFSRDQKSSRPPSSHAHDCHALRARVYDRLEHACKIRIDFRPCHVLRREPGAFPALDKALGDPAPCEVRLAKAPAATESLEAMAV